jgi:hypothetical protein
VAIDLNRALDEVLIPHEGLLTNGYRDTAKDAAGKPLGLFSCGIGHMVPTADACALLPWLLPDGSQATPDEGRACYRAVMAMPPGLRASAYAGASPLRLTEDFCRADALGRLQDEFLTGLRRLFSGFDSYPDGVQLGLIDEIYNLGEGGPPRPGHPVGNGLWTFGKQRAACAGGEWPLAGAESHVSSSIDERNAWRRKSIDPTWDGTA